MYGLVNKAIKGLVEAQYGTEVWPQICECAGIEERDFLCMKTYPDSITYDLVGAASKILDTPADKILVAFGEYWTQFSSKEGYGDLIQSIGHDLPTVLAQLDDMHARLGLSFPEMKPPSFSCVDVKPGVLKLQYRSTREGLTPFVIGLLKGLGVVLNTELKATLIQERDDKHDYDEFLVEYAAQ